MKATDLKGINSGALLLALVREALLARGAVLEQEPRDPDKVIDRKFVILAINPVNGNVYTEEDALLLCAKDEAVPPALSKYLNKCIMIGSMQGHLESIRLLIKRVKLFQKNMGGGRVPDTVGAELPRCLEGKGL